jgi:16S rRNA (adenine1518-N6/adenine1519-N6)-dimethyltransferase
MGQKLGQNFLVNKEITKKIVKSADLKANDIVLEIGPGKGILTEELAKHAGKVIAVELDKVLYNLLYNKFSNKKNVEIIKGDILKLDIVKLISNQVKNTRYGIPNTYLAGRQAKYKLVANLPYYITSPIIRMFLESETSPTEMILMVQKEVAERIVADPGKMSILSVSVQYYAQPGILFNVGKENFDPVPEVDSAVISITRNSQLETQDRDFNKNFFRIVRAGFCAKRKTLVNNLVNSFHLEKEKVEEKIKSVPLSKTVRAQELSIDEWKKLVKLML